MDARRLTVTLVDGARVVVPDSLELITPYVLQEQHDWFEDEIRFVRVLLEPGDRAIDIGANYGVYTLSTAKAVGPEGHVWAFEPASLPAGFLALSLAENGFANVTLDGRALSSAPGTAELAVSERSELNALVRRGAAAGASETVRLTSLDECLDGYGWDRMAFVKIDAEGEEANIIAGGKRFFDALSPLVQYEVKSTDRLQLDAVDAFASLGYASYRLVPALNVLVPFAAADADPYLLNLFACKPDRAEALAARGLLVRTAPSDTDREASLRAARARTGAALPDLLLRFAGRSARESRELELALALHAVSRDPACAPALRACALEVALQSLTRLVAKRATPLRQASAARAAADFGAIATAAGQLTALLALLLDLRKIEQREPYLAPSPRFDGIEPRSSLRDWLLAATLDAMDRSCSYSSFFDEEAASARLALVENLGYADDEVRRRLTLLQQRAAARGAAAE